LFASPRITNPGPETIGATATTSGNAATWSRTFCHWSIDRRRCARGCTSAADSPSPSSRRRLATSWGGEITICGW
jgi:hypothetical protein